MVATTVSDESVGPRRAGERTSRLIARAPLIAVVVAYAAGVAWRALHIISHDPRSNVYSDMALYMHTAKRLVEKGHELIPYDVLAPPGASWLFSKFLVFDPELGSLVALQFAIGALIPLAVGALAWVAFGRRTAGLAVMFASTGYFYVEYASYFLTEIYMMLLVPVTLTLYLLAVRFTKVRWVVLVGAATGVFFFLSLAFKMVALSAILGFCGIHWLFTHGPSRKIKSIALVSLCCAATPGILGMVARCTQANHGEMCFGSNKSAADFLLGHYGRIHSLQWTDATFGNPSAHQHGYEEKPSVGFSIMDSRSNSDAAWHWIKRNKLDALVLSIQHVFDTISSNAPWPVIWTPEWPQAQGYQYLFVVLVMFPTLMLGFDLARSHGVIGMLKSVEFALLSTLFGLFAAVFIATGETRYRLPFDCVFFVLAARFYTRMVRPYALARVLSALLSRPKATPVLLER